MPVDFGLPRIYPRPDEYPAPKKYVLVLSCVDFRLLDDLVRFLDADNLTNRYYHISLAGAALGVVDKRPGGSPNPFPHWRKTFIEHVQATVLLTEGNLTDVYIVQHENCGAFNLYVNGFEYLSGDDQRAVNGQYAAALLDDLRDNFCGTYNPFGLPDKNPAGKVQKKKPAVHTFFMDLRGNMTLFDTWPRKGEVVDRVCPEYGCQCPPSGGVPVAGPPPASPKRSRK